ncbi:MAG TPA: protein BatD [Sedimenticola sp.]|nr:protein BatD [Sedimenticola sp.]
MKSGAVKRSTPAAWLLFLAGLLFAGIAGATVQASLERGTVYEGEPFTLSLSIDGAGGTAEPDLTPLEKDFRLLGTGTSQQIRIVNGHRSEKRVWSVQLEPKRLGRLEIPAIAIGSERTRPLKITVREVPEQSAAGNDAPVFIETDLGPGSGKTYVQQQIRYRVRLFLGERLLDGSLSEPAPEDAVVERLGEDKRYRVVRNGTEYQVIERNYAIFPEKSGELRIPPVRFSGRIAVPGGSARSPSTRGPRSLMEQFFGDDPFANDPFFRDMPAFGSRFFGGGRGRAVSVRSRAATLAVAPRPAGYKGRYWLPAAGLELKDSWAGEPPELRAGEPVTRTITIEAKGLESSQIPRIDLTAPPGVRLYPEPAESENRTDGSWVFGQSRQRWTYIPSREGTLEVPALTLTWWDVTAGRERTARLPGWRLKVLPGVDAGTLAENPPASPTPATQGTAGAPPGTVPAMARIRDWLEREWPRAALAAALPVLLLLSWWFWRRRKPAAAPPAGETAGHASVASSADRKAALAALRRACDAGDAPAAARALLELGAARWPEDPPASLGALASRLDGAEEALRQLDRVLYGQGGTGWDGAALWQRFQDGIPEQGDDTKGRGEGPLEPLYPQRA